ncbi:MAG TPA: alpha/beta hydrolase [Clostridiales bacterium]|nr:alpha/beta hydrolase [Clostridiales bacterium]HCU56584.1 alpha/beta hydrolase [Clostridiales bacterium]
MEEFKLVGDGTEFACYLWNEVERPIAVVQIAHGMGEHCGRYNDFASFLNKNGFLVVAEDHRGHGKTCGNIEDLGKVEGDSYHDTIGDMIALTKYAEKKFKLPIVLFGHSYGSFLTQGYIERNGGALSGVVLSGSAYMNTTQVAFGRLVAKIQNALFGGRKPAKLIAKLSFGAYDKQFKSENQPFAWLTRDKEVIKKYIEDVYCGASYTMSIGFQKSFFYGLKGVYRSSELQKIPKDLPIFIAGGDRDPVGGNGALVSKLYDQYKGLGIKDVAVKLYPEARHEILNEINKEEVYADILAFIQRVTAPKAE